MSAEPLLPFTIEEFQIRIARVRAGMEARGLEALIITTPENIYYLTGYSTPAYYSTQAVVLPLAGEPFLLTYAVEAELVRQISWVGTFAAYGPNDQPVPVLAAALRSRGLAAIRLGLEQRSWFFPVALFQQLAAELGGAAIADGSGIVEECRAVKSAAELDWIRAGARVASQSMQAVHDTIRPGATENDLAAAAYAAALRAGGEFPGSPPYVSSGPRVWLPHASWDRRVLAPGDQVFIELSGCVRRYSGALMRTFCLGGRPAPELERLEQAIIAGLDAAIGALRPGARSGDVDAACREPIAAAGFSYPHESGYSIGVCYPPGWNETHVFNLKPGDQRRIVPNMVFHLVPHVILPGVGAVGLSETVLVSEHGAEVLTTFPREMIRL